MTMGRLYYGNGSEPIELPDRALAHLRVLATTKLRRSESFSVALRNTADPLAGRSVIWLHCSIPLRFEFDGAEPEAVDRRLLEELAQSAMATGGITLDIADDALTSPVARRHLERAA